MTMRVRMHGNIDLKDPSDADGFAADFNSFSEHLASHGFVIHWSFSKRISHAGYDAKEPKTSYYVSMDFADMTYANDCYKYVQKNQEPLRSLHHSMNSRVIRKTTQFYLTEEILLSD